MWVCKCACVCVLVSVLVLLVLYTCMRDCTFKFACLVEASCLFGRK